MGFGDVLERIGGMGRFQITQAIFLCFPISLISWHNLLQNFTAAIPNHWCKINDTGIFNTSKEGWMSLVSPLDDNGRPESCLEFVEIQWRPVGSNITSLNNTDAETRSCTMGWEYDRKDYLSTIITQWDLVCGHKTRRQLAQALYMAGVLVGAILLGTLSDRYGRRALLIWSYFQMLVCGICTAFSPNYLSYCVFRFLGGIANPGIGFNSNSLNIEWVPTKVRTITGTLGGYSFTIGQLTLAGLAYGIRDWRWLQFTVSVPYFIFFLCSWWLPESARWLIFSGNPSKAINELKKVAKYNGKLEEAEKITLESLKVDMMKEMACSKSSYTILDLFRTRTMRRTSFALSCIWFSTSFAFYGLAMDLQKFGVSIYLMQVIFGAVDIPAKIIATTSMSYIGRRVTQFSCLTLGGLAILANTFLPNELQLLRTSLTVFGKGCIASSFTCVLLYTTELYPTVIRQTGVGWCSTMSRIGGIVAPLMKLLGEFYPFLPLLIYGGSLIISGLMVYFLPETVNKPLPDTMEDVEIGRKKTPQKEEKKEVVPLHTVTPDSACVNL